MNVVIREAKPEDAEQIAEVNTLTWQTSFKGLIGDDFLYDLSTEDGALRWKEYIKSKVNGKGVFVAEEEGTIIGFCSVSKSNKEYEGMNIGQLGSIYVLPERQGLGVGKKLIARGISFLKENGFTKVILGSLPNNINSIRFYETVGFTYTGKTVSRKLGDIPIKEAYYILDLKRDS